MKNEDMKIGIMGGTFNPIHLGHLLLAQFAYEEASLDHILFIPSKNPPHKSRAELVEDEHRLNMVKLAVMDNPLFSVSTIELDRSGTTYTVDTLRELKIRYPQKEFFFLAGADSFLHFKSWREPEQISDLCTLVISARNEVTLSELEKQKDNLKQCYGTKSILLSMPKIDISSTEIRERRKLQKSIRYFVPDSVYDYIIEKELYRSS